MNLQRRRILVTAFAGLALVPLAAGFPGSARRVLGEGAASPAVPIAFGDLTDWSLRNAKAAAVTIAPDRASVSILFEGLEINLQKATDPLVDGVVWSASFPVLLPDDRSMAGYRADIRGSIARTSGADVVMVCQIGSASEAFSWPLEPSEAADGAIPILTQNFSVTVMAPESVFAKSENSARPGPLPLTLCCILFARRRTAADVATLSVVSIDSRAVV